VPAHVITPPTGEPVSLAQAKAHLRLDVALDDDYVSALIKAARQYTEEVCWRGILLQTWELVLPGFLGDDRFDLGERARRHFYLPIGYEWSNADRAYRFLPFIELERGQLAANLAGDAVKYIDPNGVQQTLDPSVYVVDNVHTPARLRVAYGQSWPLTRDQWDAVRVQYQVGWADAASVPLPLVQAMLLLISQLYEHRTPEVAGVITPVQFAYDALVAPYRLNRIE
jgi:hypothetical protein